jgi:cyclopropane fatty-acyl-phospholipid synthase-like methyltransferase
MNDAERRRIVEEGYDALDGVYRAWVERDGYRMTFLDRVLRAVPTGSDVLEIGCGPGTDSRALADGRRYTGIDLSGVQLAHARRTVPTGTFVHADVLDVAFPAASFDAAVALYVFGHVPRDRLPELLVRIRRWLRPGGLLAASFGTSDTPGAIQPKWLSAADMYFSSLPAADTDSLLRRQGYSIEMAETVTEVEPGEGPATFHWVIARTASEDGGTS